MIKRQNRGKRKTRHGIVLDLLEPKHRELLLEHNQIKEHSNDDQYLKILFKIRDLELNNQHFERLRVDPRTEEIVDLQELKESFRIVDWNCAYCLADIESSMNNFKPKNFVCDDCNERYIDGVRWVPNTIYENALKFTKHCKKIMREDQKKFMKFIKKNSKK